MSFSKFAILPEILQAIKELGYETPTPIQDMAIPPALEGKDVLAQAQTGTGKTAAFSLPLLSKIEKKKSIQLIVLTPTRELAQQVSDDIKKYSKHLSLKVATVVGGKSYRDQYRALEVAQILVATPGRLIDMLESNKIPNLETKFVVLDEADKMLDMGFQEDLEKIVEFLPQEKQTLLFSATFPRHILRLADIWLKPDAVRLQANSENSTNEAIEQKFCVVYRDEKDEALGRLLQSFGKCKVLVFCEMKRDADRVGAFLAKQRFNSMILHGDTEQNRREAIMGEFRRMSEGVLVATDIAARGLDVADITHVINFQIPVRFDSYVHRIGRTGRAGRSGMAYTLITPDEEPQLFRLEKITKSKLEFQPIPTLNSLSVSKVGMLKTQLESMSVKEKFTKLATDLIAELTPEEVVSKLLQKFMSAEFTEGRDQLGLTADDFARLRDKKKRTFRDDVNQNGFTSRRSTRGGGRNERSRSFGGDRGERRSFGEGGGDRRPRFEGGGERKPRFEGAGEGDRPRRSFNSERSERPAREGGERKPRFEGSGEGDRPRRNFNSERSERPAREGGGDRGFKPRSERAPRAIGAGKSGADGAGRSRDEGKMSFREERKTKGRFAERFGFGGFEKEDSPKGAGGGKEDRSIFKMGRKKSSEEIVW